MEKNCLTCRYEPMWERDEYKTISGYCRIDVSLPFGSSLELPIMIKRHSGVEVRYPDRSIYGCHSDCPAWQQKGE